MTAAAKPPRRVHAKQTCAGVALIAVLWLAVVVTAALVAPK